MNKLIPFTVVALGVAGLVACGSGSSTGGAGGTRNSSSLVVQVDDDQRTAALQRAHDASTSVASTISRLVVRRAQAQTAGVAIFVDGNQVAVTDASGTAAVALSPGNFEVCILDPDVAANCTTITVVADSVVVVSDVDIGADGTVTIGNIRSEDARADMAGPDAADNAALTLICHQTGAGQFTIAVAEPAVVQGHLAHGDTRGACPQDTGEDGDNTAIGGPPDEAGPPEGTPDNAGGNGGGDTEDA